MVKAVIKKLSIMLTILLAQLTISWAMDPNDYPGNPDMGYMPQPPGSEFDQYPENIPDEYPYQYQESYPGEGSHSQDQVKLLSDPEIPAFGNIPDEQSYQYPESYPGKGFRNPDQDQFQPQPGSSAFFTSEEPVDYGSLVDAGPFSSPNLLSQVPEGNGLWIADALGGLRRTSLNVPTGSWANQEIVPSIEGELVVHYQALDGRIQSRSMGHVKPYRRYWTWFYQDIPGTYEVWYTIGGFYHSNHVWFYVDPSWPWWYGGYVYTPYYYDYRYYYWESPVYRPYIYYLPSIYTPVIYGTTIHKGIDLYRPRDRVPDWFPERFYDGFQDWTLYRASDRSHGRLPDRVFTSMESHMSISSGIHMSSSSSSSIRVRV